jgi:tRNA(Ile)-lysidine synthase
MTKPVDAIIAESSGVFSSESLYTFLCAHRVSARHSRLLVAFSGGLDSTTLLHAAARLRDRYGLPLLALHADHGLHPDSAAWREHCAAQCRAFAVEYLATSLVIAGSTPSGVEAAARMARYAWLAATMRDDDQLMTAHHADDQAETVVLQLLRGAGPRGLAAMPAAKPFGPGVLLRPLLGYSRSALTDYARNHGLHWIEDPANADDRYDRSYLRQRLMPVLCARWSGAASAIRRSARHCAAVEGLLDDLARLDLTRCAARASSARLPATHALSLARLRDLSDERLANALRAWARAAGVRAPSTRKLGEAVRQLVRLSGSGGCVEWDDAALRRYRDALYLVTGHPRRDGPASAVPWIPDRPLDLPHLGLRLVVRATSGAGISPEILRDTQLTVRWRQGGERCQPAGSRHRKQLKKLYQERRVPPWERERIPLVYLHERLLAVPGVVVCEPFAAARGQGGVDIALESADADYDAATHDDATR